MEKGQIEIAISFPEPGEIPNKMATWKYFSTWTKIVYFLIPFEEKNAVAQRRRVTKNQYHFWNREELLYKMILLIFFLNKLKRPFEE